jgi:hypothetical protein
MWEIWFFHRAFGEEECLRDLFVAVPTRHQAQDLSFALGELLADPAARSGLQATETAQHPLGDGGFD